MIEIETQRLTIISETKENAMNKPTILFILVLTLFGCAFAGEGTTYFKSEVAGQDLPFSDAALVGNTLYVSGKGVFCRALGRFLKTRKKKLVY